ncbi:uncharacterized protein MKK02DRAFT_39244 [Dioszegia hungarica]|uniref:DUF1275 domain protein n=1 Tax=Dioszegia hungarica TaxID=4972 RepID=A0AA38H5T6_9TREE|nr:uncharacterized protein MKK02DRAFT_39244 [Dioszegia hungarica]KAI9633266.1 hypothetical protein MKK02DRAFT_39244 [Dioszegia hungarica]
MGDSLPTTAVHTGTSTPAPREKPDPTDMMADSPPSSPTSSTVVSRALHRLNNDVDPKQCISISIYACFLTGFTSSPSFSACYVWCGFQTGNLAQLGLAAARAFSMDPYRTYGFQKPDQQALTSLLAFILGTCCGRIGDKWGNRTRRWLMSATLVQVLLAMAAALTAWKSGETGIALERGEPSWHTPLGMAALAFLSATMGIQGIVGKRIASPMNTTVVLTTTWVELFNDPLLLTAHLAPSRDVRLMGVSGVILGAFISRAILQSPAGQAGCLGVLAGLRLIQALWWGFVPGVKVDWEKVGKGVSTSKDVRGGAVL